MFRRAVGLHIFVAIFDRAPEKTNNCQSARLIEYTVRSPTDPSTTLEPHDQGIVWFSVAKNRRSTDFQAPKL